MTEKQCKGREINLQEIFSKDKDSRKGLLWEVRRWFWSRI